MSIQRRRGAAASNPEIIAAICGNARLTVQRERVGGRKPRLLQLQYTLNYSDHSSTRLRVAEKPREQDTKIATARVPRTWTRAAQRSQLHHSNHHWSHNELSGL